MRLFGYIITIRPDIPPWRTLPPDQQQTLIELKRDEISDCIKDVAETMLDLECDPVDELLADYFGGHHYDQ